jgi:hypothetical protein
MTNEENPVIQAAKEYERNSAQYVTMRHLGTILGVSSHVVGRKLKEVGLRNAEGHPTDKAREGRFTTWTFVEEKFNLDLWHQEKTLIVLRPLIEEKK